MSTAPDPVRRIRELTRASDAGLLDYRGTITIRRVEHYEVEIAGGERVSLPPEDVLPTIERLEAVAAASAEGLIARLHDTNGEFYNLALKRGGIVQLFSDEVLPWLAGYRAGASAKGRAPRATDTAAIHAVLVDTALEDQIRLRLLALMEAGGVTQAEMARRVGKSAQWISASLKFGAGINIRIAEKMIRALDDRRWLLGVSMPEGVRPAGLPEGYPTAYEPVGAAALRDALDGAARKLLRYVGPQAPNRALTAPEVRVAVGKAVHEVPVGEFPAWYRGLRDHDAYPRKVDAS